MKHLTLAAASIIGATAALAETPVLTVYTYDSFVTEWGPGPAVEAAFEETCGCDLQFVGAGDGAALLRASSWKAHDRMRILCWGWIRT